MSKQIELYSDGSCLGNPGPGAWACVLRYKERAKLFWGPAEAGDNTTANRAEMLAVINGLKAIKQDDCEIFVYTDSRYVAMGMADQWKIKSNKDLWSVLARERKRFVGVYANWIRGHDGHKWNTIADDQAQTVARKAAKQQYDYSPDGGIVVS